MNQREEQGLYVENDWLVAMDGETCLRKFRPDATVHVKDSYAAAVAVLNSRKIDWVALDFRFLGVKSENSGGLELLQYLSAERFRDIVVVSVSGTPEFHILQALREMGIDKKPEAFFPKPTDFKRVAAYIGNRLTGEAIHPSEMPQPAHDFQPRP